MLRGKQARRAHGQKLTRFIKTRFTIVNQDSKWTRHSLLASLSYFMRNTSTQPQQKSSFHTNSVNVMSPFHTNSVHVKSPFHTNSVHVKSPFHTNSVHVKSPFHTSSVHVKSPFHTNSVHVKSPFHTNLVHVKSPFHTNSVHVKSPFHTNSVHEPATAGPVQFTQSVHTVFFSSYSSPR